MSCIEFEAALQPYIDGEVDWATRRQADALVAECAGCADLLQRERNFRRLVRGQPRELAPGGLRMKIATVVRAAGRTTASLDRRGHAHRRRHRHG